MSQGLERVRQAARQRKRQAFTALLHHVTVDALREAFLALKRRAAPGVDGVTWQDYELGLEDRFQDLHTRVHRGTYRALPVRRRFMPKPDGRQRPLGIAALEDKIVQRAVVTVLNAIYEEDFLGFSYGFRPGRGQHDALDALCVAIKGKRVNWVLDADIKGFFDAVDHSWLLRFVRHRVGDERITRLVGKWLEAGLLEDGNWSASDQGTPQGAVISPLLANVYLHYVFDLWAQQWRRREVKGDMFVVLYADDLVVGFELEAEARRFWDAMRTRFEQVPTPRAKTPPIRRSSSTPWICCMPATWMASASSPATATSPDWPRACERQARWSMASASARRPSHSSRPATSSSSWKC